MLTASDNICYLKGVGEKRAEILKSRGIDTVGALLRFYPRSYLDWSSTVSIAECPFFENVCIRARVVSPVDSSKTKSGIAVYGFEVSDGTERMGIMLYNQGYLASQIRVGREYLFYGRVDGNFYLKQMRSPIIKEIGAVALQPIYRTAGSITSKGFEKLVKTALSAVSLPETLSEDIRQKHGLCDIKTAVENIHFPKTAELLEKARRRLVFEELFVLQVGLSFLKRRSRGESGCRITNGFFAEFEALLPFSLTEAQKRVTLECLTDMSSGRPMNRLVQGDVGSGKTAVAAALVFAAAKNGFQSALMAPTEILAEQHYRTVTSMLNGSGIECVLLTGSLTKKKKTAVKELLQAGDALIAIGTHALLSEDVEFKRLGLVITDEQHRFGVAQRGKLSSKGNNPHTLVMSATPIPRTLGLIIYGDLDISIIDEYPKGRQKINTYCVNSSYRQRIYRYIKKFLQLGRQGYIVCPLVEENEDIDITPAVEYYERLSKGEFANYSLGLLHGKMKPAEKERVMRGFADGEIQLLISTTVIEVGIDVPNAVIMAVENAERFGLSQLHQLRGRIGRGEYASDCILISDSKSAETRKRLDIMRKTSDGFKIADADLELRGPGDFLGSRQHGLPDLRIADIFADRETLHSAGTEAAHLLDGDPRLSKPENIALRTEITELYKKLNAN